MGEKEVLAAKVLKEAGSWSSIQIRMEIKHLKPSVSPTRYTFTFDHYIENATGERYYEQISRNSTKRISRTENYYDGKIFTSILYDRSDPKLQKQVAVRSSFGEEADRDIRECPYPMRSFYVNLQPLSDAIPKGKLLDSSTVLDRQCSKIEFPNTGPRAGRTRSQIYHLDQQTGIPLKIETISDGKTLLVWEALSFDEVQGHHFPLRSHLLSEGKAIYDFSVKELKYDEVRKPSFFRPVISQGISKVDSREKAALPADSPLAVSGAIPRGEHMLPDPASGMPMIQHFNSESGVPPTHWSNWTPTVIAGLGTALLITVFMTKWRSKS